MPTLVAAPPPRAERSSAPAVRHARRGKQASGDANTNAMDCTLPPLGRTHQTKGYHVCPCYGHETALPNYKLLAMPRTNNYYAATGGCPCIPRAPAHPGSWRLKKAQMRSTTHRCGHGCVNKPHVKPAASVHACCMHSGYQYGWRPGPHTVKGKNTAATGKCDTFGNLAFKSKSKAYLPIEDDVSDLSSVGPQKLQDLEALILEEHEARARVESDVRELKDIDESGTAELYMGDRSVEDKRRFIQQATLEQLNELLREIKQIVGRPLNQPNMDLLRRIIRRQELLMRKRAYEADRDCGTTKLN